MHRHLGEAEQVMTGRTFQQRQLEGAILYDTTGTILVQVNDHGQFLHGLFRKQWRKGAWDNKELDPYVLSGYYYRNQNALCGPDGLPRPEFEVPGLLVGPEGTTGFGGLCLPQTASHIY